MTKQEGGIQMNSARTGLRPASFRRGLFGGKVAIITGASHGIGASTARIFADAGATVVLAARDEQALAAVAKEIDAAGGQALVVPTDVVDASSVEHLVERTLAAYGRLDAAFNNAGGGYIPVPIADIAVEEFDRVVAVNLRGVFLSMKYQIPAMLESGGGSIVNMTSTVWHRDRSSTIGSVRSLTSSASPSLRQTRCIGSACPRRWAPRWPGCAPTSRPSSPER